MSGDILNIRLSCTKVSDTRNTVILQGHAYGLDKYVGNGNTYFTNKLIPKWAEELMK